MLSWEIDHIYAEHDDVHEGYFQAWTAELASGAEEISRIGMFRHLYDHQEGEYEV